MTDRIQTLQAMHDSEINASISWFFDGQFHARLGDDMNGFVAESVFASLDAAVDWLVAQAIKHYPGSAFDRAAPAQPVEEAVWLIRKGGYFYRPNRAGYTSSWAEAGRYTKAEAEAEAAIEPWHMRAIHQDDWPRPAPAQPVEELTR